ncbi:10914_t:CDS:2 [Paraglomus occultum]|uniref:10914_t:CDS:1 n=1 Tax=Paraglomus occultum TaxID=144539 RepID=A0A9N9FUA1_9GLOM|nr:10914_t:CDS:2 [Paraglomus occultum]
MAQRDTNLKILFILSFILNKNDYKAVKRVYDLTRNASPFRGNDRDSARGLPDLETFESVLGRNSHNHTSAFSAALCLHDSCLPDTSRRSIKAYGFGYTAMTGIGLAYGITQAVGARTIKTLFRAAEQTTNANLQAPDTDFDTNDLDRFASISDDERSTRSILRSHIQRYVPVRLIPPFVSALIASQTLRLVKNQNTRNVIIVFLFVKVLEFGFKLLQGIKVIPQLPKWMGPWLLFPLSSAQLIYAYLYHPDTFQASSAYSRFITSRSSAYLPPLPPDHISPYPWPSESEILSSLATLTTLNYPVFLSPKINRDGPALPSILRTIQPVLESAHPAHNRMACALMHPDEPSCWLTLWKFVNKEFASALKYSVIIFLLPYVLKINKIWESPCRFFYKFILNTLPSAAQTATFISNSIGTAWASICLFQSIFPNKFMPTTRICLGGFLGGLWVLVEPKERQLAIGMYSLRLSLESLWKVLVKTGKVKNIRDGDVFLFAFSTACLMSIYELQPKYMSALMRKQIELRIKPRENQSAFGVDEAEMEE